jgi:hypothetical protein
VTLEVRERLGILHAGKTDATNSAFHGKSLHPRPNVELEPRRRHGRQYYKHLALELWITYLALMATCVTTSLLLWQLLNMSSNSLLSGDTWSIIEQSAFTLLALMLIYGGVVYQLARIGYYKRLRAHRPGPQEKIETHFLEYPAPPVTILIPS